MEKRILLVLLLINCFFAGFTQVKISGKTLDSDNKPIGFITLRLLKDSIVVQALVSDSLGNFNILNVPQGTYSLNSSFIGAFRSSQSFNLKRDTALFVNLEFTFGKDLKEIVIRSNRKIIEQRGDKLLFNVENSPLNKGFDGLEVLQRSPKILFNSKGELLIKNKSALIFVNGRKLNLAGEDLNAYLSSLNSEEIKRLEIQDVTTSETDASSDGGAINIVLQHPSKGFRTILKSSYNYRKKTFGTYTGAANLNYGSEKWNAYLNVDYRNNKDKGHYNQEFDYLGENKRNIQNGNFIQRNNSLGWRSGFAFYPNKRQEFGVEFYTNNSKAAYSDNQLLNLYNPEITVSAENKSATDDKTDIWYLTGNYTFKIDTIGSSIKFIGDYGKNDLERTNLVSTTYSLGNISSGQSSFETVAPSAYYTLQSDYNQKLRSGWQLFSGLKYGNITRDNSLDIAYFNNGQWIPNSSGNEDFTNREHILAGYITSEKTFGDNQYLKFGLRTEHTRVNGLNRLNNKNTNQDYTNFFPSLYYRFNVSSKDNLSVSYKRSITRPSFRDLNSFVIKQNDFLYQLGNPDLKPQYNDRADLTYQKGNQSLSLYGRLGNNVIQNVYYVRDDVNYVQPQNFGRISDFGLDHSYYGNITSWLYAKFSEGVFFYSFHNNVLSASKPSFYSSIYLQVKLPERLLLEIFNKYWNSYQFYNTLGAEQYKLDVAVKKTFFKDKVIARLNFNDLFNTQRDKNYSVYQTFNFDFYQKRLTRSVLFSIQYNFSNKGKVKDNFIQSGNQSRDRL